MNGKRRSVESICASAGRDVESATRPLMAPIYQGSVFEVESLELLDEIYAGSKDGFIYSRDANPNVETLERVVAELENADDAVAFASGMGAIGNTLSFDGRGWGHGFGGGRAIRWYEPAFEATSAEARGSGGVRGRDGPGAR